MRARYRYQAACSAALAGTGQGIEVPPLDGPTQARWRQQALDWLTADLAYGTKLVHSGPPQARDVVVRILRYWKADPDLATIRDEDALGRLPDTERRAWRDLWAAVDTLIEATY
jgi:hypothetical protein